MRKTNRLLAFVLTCVMAFGVLFGAQNVSAAEFGATKAEMEALLKECYDNNPMEPVEDKFVYQFERQILNYARSGAVTDEQKKAYTNSLTDELKVSGTGKLSSAGKNALAVMALNAMKCDPTNVNGYNVVEPLKDANFVNQNENMYDLTYAMLALYSYDVSTDMTSYIENLLSYQVADGGFNAFPLWGDATADDTATAVQALAPYYNTDENVKQAVDKALVFMQNKLDPGTGAAVNYKSQPSADTTAQVILALVNLGIDPAKDEHFCVTGKNLVQVLYDFYCGKGKFESNFNGGVDDYATVQCIQAMIAYNRLLNGQTAFYDMSDLRQPATHKYPVLEGADQQVDVAAGGTLSIRIDCPMEKFTGVEIDGVVVDPKYYTVTSGSTIITFTAEYVNALSAGAHTVAVAFTDGVANVGFSLTKPAEQKPDNQEQQDENSKDEDEQTVEQKDTSKDKNDKTTDNGKSTQENVKSPKTGEEFPVAVIAILLLTLGSGAYIKTRSGKQ